MGSGRLGPAILPRRRTGSADAGSVSGSAATPPIPGILEPVQGTVQVDLVHHQERKDEVSQGNAANEGEGRLTGEEAGPMVVL